MARYRLVPATYVDEDGLACEKTTPGAVLVSAARPRAGIDFRMEQLQEGKKRHKRPGCGTKQHQPPSQRSRRRRGIACIPSLLKYFIAVFTSSCS